jgi:hypothetical protein
VRISDKYVITQPPPTTVKVGGRTFTILFPELLRPLSPPERRVLKESISCRRRVIVPVVVDEKDGVIDGGHRITLAAELGLPLEAVPLRVESGLSLEQKAAMAHSLNVSRRHLVAKDWKEMKWRREERIKKAVELRRQGMSTRDIAAETGVSQKRVRDDLVAATEQGYSVEPEGGVVHGQDGKDRPAAAPPASGSEAEDRVQTEPDFLELAPDFDTAPPARQVRGKGVAPDLLRTFAIPRQADDFAAAVKANRIPAARHDEAARYARENDLLGKQMAKQMADWWYTASGARARDIELIERDAAMKRSRRYYRDGDLGVFLADIADKSRDLARDLEKAADAACYYENQEQRDRWRQDFAALASLLQRLVEGLTGPATPLPEGAAGERQQLPAKP